MGDVIVDVDVLTEDAESVWQAASDSMVGMKGALPVLKVSDFSLPFDCFSLSEAYSAAIQALQSYIDGGSTEFLRFEKNLLDAVIIYGESHGMSADDIAALEAEIDV